MAMKLYEEHLGPEATEEQAHRMVELLKERGYDVEYGQPGRLDERLDEGVPDSVWQECLDIVSEESFS